MERKVQMLNTKAANRITNKQRNVSRKRKLEASKVELMDEDLDQIVIETSAVVSEGMREQELAQQERQKFHLASSLTKQSILMVSGDQSQTGHLSQTGEANQPKRPMNAFMVWGQAIRRELHNRFSNVQNAVLSKSLGRVWKRLDSIEKEPYMTKASIIKNNHKRDYPNYRYQPRRIQEKQYRLNQQQSNRNPKQLEQRPPAASPLPKSSVRNPIIISDPPPTSQVLMVDGMQQLPVRDFVEESDIKLESYDIERWRAANACAVNNGDESASGQAMFHQARRSPPRNNLNDFQNYAEYTMPFIESDKNDDNIQTESQTNFITSEQIQIPVDERHQHQTRLFYEQPTVGHPNDHQLDTQMAFQPQDNNNISNNSSFCLSHHQVQHQPNHSSNIYTGSNSDCICCTKTRREQKECQPATNILTNSLSPTTSTSITNRISRQTTGCTTYDQPYGCGLMTAADPANSHGPILSEFHISDYQNSDQYHTPQCAYTPFY